MASLPVSGWIRRKGASSFSSVAIRSYGAGLSLQPTPGSFGSTWTSTKRSLPSPQSAQTSSLCPACAIRMTPGRCACYWLWMKRMAAFPGRFCPRTAARSLPCSFRPQIPTLASKRQWICACVQSRSNSSPSRLKGKPGTFWICSLSSFNS